VKRMKLKQKYFQLLIDNVDKYYVLLAR